METSNKTDSTATAKVKKPSAKVADASERTDVPAVEKAFDILELLATTPHGLTMNEISVSLNRTMGEIYRVALCLNKRGYIEQDPTSSRYALTLRLFELAHQNLPTNRLVRRALPLLENLALRCEQSCHLAVLYESSVLVLASAPSPRPAGYSVKAGAVFPLVDTSSGMVILAHLKPEARDNVLESLTAEERAPALKRISDISRKGFERKKSRMVSGVLNFSAPVFDHAGVVGALTMAYIEQVNQKTTQDQALAEVLASAQELSALLGKTQE